MSHGRYHREALTREQPTSCRGPCSAAGTPVAWRPLPRILRPPSCRGQRRQFPSPAPLLPSPARGSRRGPGVAVGPHALVSPHSGASDRILKQLRKTTHGDLAPKKKREKKKNPARGGRPGRWVGGGGASRGRGRALASSPPSARPGAGGGPRRRRENSIVWGRAARPAPRTSAAGRVDACSRGLPGRSVLFSLGGRVLGYCFFSVALWELGVLARGLAAAGGPYRGAKHLVALRGGLLACSGVGLLGEWAKYNGRTGGVIEDVSAAKAAQ